MNAYFYASAVMYALQSSVLCTTDRNIYLALELTGYEFQDGLAFIFITDLINSVSTDLFSMPF